MNLTQKTIISTTVGKNPLEEIDSQQKSPKCSTWIQSQRQQNDFCSFPRQTIQYHGNPSLCPTSKAEEAEVGQFYEDLQDLLELTSKKDVLFITRDWNAKVGSQETPGITGKFGRGVQNEAGQRVLPREHTGHTKHPLPTTREDSTHGHHQMANIEIRLIIFFAAKDGEALYSPKKKKKVLLSKAQTKEPLDESERG